MSSVCPANFFCFDKNTFVLVFVSLLIVTGYLLHTNRSKLEQEKVDLSQALRTYQANLEQSQKQLQNVQHNLTTQQLQERDRYDRLHNPLRAPLQKHVAINIPTRGEVCHFQQVGALIENRTSGDSKVLPLYGKPTYPGSRYWLYYTNSDAYSPVKLPVNSKNRCCLDDQGCEELWAESDVSVQGFSNGFKVNLYKFDKPRYIPYV